MYIYIYILYILGIGAPLSCCNHSPPQPAERRKFTKNTSFPPEFQGRDHSRVTPASCNLYRRIGREIQHLNRGFEVFQGGPADRNSNELWLENGAPRAPTRVVASGCVWYII